MDTENSEVGTDVAVAMGLRFPLSQQEGGELRFDVTSLSDTAFGTVLASGGLNY